MTRKKMGLIFCLTMGTVLFASGEEVKAKALEIKAPHGQAQVQIAQLRTTNNPARYCAALFNKLYRLYYGDSVRIHFYRDKLLIPQGMSLSNLIKGLNDYYFTDNDGNAYKIDWKTSKDFPITSETIDNIPLNNSEGAFQYIINRVFGDSGLNGEGISVDVYPISRLIQVSVKSQQPDEREKFYNTDYLPDGQNNLKAKDNLYIRSQDNQAPSANDLEKNTNENPAKASQTTNTEASKNKAQLNWQS